MRTSSSMLRGLLLGTVAATAVLVLLGARADNAAARVPAALRGAWLSQDDGGSAVLGYTFNADGTYFFTGLLAQQRAGGLWTYRITARGTVTVRGNRLTLRPRSGTREVHDPDVPSRSTRGPIRRTTERYRWSVVGRGRNAVLSLTDATDNTVEYEPARP
jgi:hypothetical protein